MQEKEFIALLKSTIKENRLDIIPDGDLMKICGRAREITDSKRIMDLELSDAIYTLLKEIEKRGLTQDCYPDITGEKKTTPKKTVSRKNHAKKSAILIGLGVLCYVFSYLLSLINKPRPDVLDLPTSTFNMIVGGGFELLGFILILVAILFGFRAVIYKIKMRKTSSVIQNNEPVVFTENMRQSYKKIILRWACYVSIYCVAVSMMPKVIPVLSGAGGRDIAAIYYWMDFIGLAIVLSFIAAVCGLIIGVFEIYKSAFGISKSGENGQEESTALTVWSIISCFVPASVLLLFVYKHSDLLVLFGH